MKVSKIFGCVLGLHMGVIAILVVQPGCRTTQPPTQTSPSYQQNRTLNGVSLTQARDTDGMIPATRVDTPLDSAFNAGFGDGADGRYAPKRPSIESDSFPVLSPVIDSPATVDVAGSSMESYTVKKGDSLWAIAKRYDVSVNELYSANGLNQNSVLKVGQQIQIPVEGGTVTVNTVTPDAYQPSNYNTGTTSYTVKGGDTLSKIAKNHDTTVNAIKAANNKSSDMIRVGETLILPVSDARGTSGANAPAASPAPAAARTSSASASNFTSAPAGGGRTHTVKAGEYPATIARQYGMTASELLAMNGITDPRKLQVGQKLKVNASGSSENVDSRTETVRAAQPASSGSASSTRSPSFSTGASAGGRSNSSSTTSSAQPVQIRVVEADPLIESEVDDFDADSMFDSAVEIPVIRMEDGQ